MPKRNHSTRTHRPRAKWQAVPRPAAAPAGPLAREALALMGDASLARQCGLRVVALALLPYPRMLTVRESRT